MKKLNQNIELTSPLVCVQWLKEHLNHKDLVVLDASIKKATSNDDVFEDFQIQGASYFDIKHKFSDTTSPFPNTVPSEAQFEREARTLGINNSSVIVVYDDKGIYSSARAWWLFKAFGHKKVAVLDGGFPEWKKQNFPIEEKQDTYSRNGNFIARYISHYFKFFNDIKVASAKEDIQILDARSSERFNGSVEEPRKGLRSGHIPNSNSLPFSSLLKAGKVKNLKALKDSFHNVNPHNKRIIFSCGSGITACILALGAELVGFKDFSVYDGSWTEYGTLVK